MLSLFLEKKGKMFSKRKKVRSEFRGWVRLEHGVSMTSFITVIGIAFIIPIILHKFKLRVIPVVVAEIIAGIIVGKSGLNIVETDMWLETLSLLGFIFLMFLSGLEIDFSVLNNKKKEKKETYNPFKVSMLLFGLMLGISFLSSSVLVWVGVVEEPFLMTLIISTISLGVVLPVLKESGLIDTKYGQTILITTVLSDFITMILLAVYVMVSSKNSQNVVLILVLFVVTFFSYRFIKKFFKIKIFETLMSGTIQLGMRGVFALILIFVGISQSLGVEAILGAFLAGMIVSLLNPKKEFVKQLDSFGYGFLIPIFFVMVGVELDLKTSLTDKNTLILIPLLLVAMYITKVVSSIAMRKWFGWKETISAGMIMTSTLSLVVAASQVALDLGFIDEKTNAALIIVAVITCLISPIYFNRNSPTYEKEEKALKVSIIGSNRVTLATSLSLIKDNYDVRLFTRHKESTDDTRYPFMDVKNYEINTLKENEVFDCDILIAATSDESRNIEISNFAKEFGINDVIVKIEGTSKQIEMSKQGYIIYSENLSPIVMLRAFVEQPTMAKMLSDKPENIQEFVLTKEKFDGIKIRDFKELRDILILQIFRDNKYIVPQGNTELKVGDKIVVNGEPEVIESIKKTLSY